jgi:hypothetical protein
MRKVTTLILIALAIFAMTALLVNAEEATNDFVGAKKCKTCHKGVHAAWLTTGHATAYDSLNEEQKKDKKCVACHTTGTTAKGVLLEGVQCESCHGAGSAYKSAKIMSKKKWKADPDTHKKMAVDAGLIYPTAEVCTTCHKKEGNDNFKPFDFEKRKGEVHKVVK